MKACHWEHVGGRALQTVLCHAPKGGRKQCPAGWTTDPPIPRWGSQGQSFFVCLRIKATPAPKIVPGTLSKLR